MRDLFAARDIVVFYDRSSGVHFANRESQIDFNRALSGYDTIFGTDFARRMPKDPVRVMSVLENYFRLRLGEGKRRITSYNVCYTKLLRKAARRIARFDIVQTGFSPSRSRMVSGASATAETVLGRAGSARKKATRA